METFGTWSATRCRQNPEGSCSQLFLSSSVLMALGGSILGLDFKQKCSLAYAYRCDATPGRSPLLPQYLDMEHCATGKALGAGREWKGHAPGCSSVLLT